MSVIAWLRADQRRLDLAIAAVTTLIGMLLVRGAPDEYDVGWPEVVAGVGAFVLLAFRRRHTPVLLAIALVWTSIHVAVWDRPTPMVFAILVLLTTACVGLDRWPAIGLGAVVAAWLYTIGLVTSRTEYGDARAVIGIAWAAGAVGIADAVRSWRSYRETAEEQVRTAVMAAEAEASRQVSEERLVIARELHDLLAHNLSVMNVQTGAALHLLRSDPDQAEASLLTARDAGGTVLDELRELLAVLRRDGDDAAPTSSLPSSDDISGLVDTMRAAGSNVTWNSSGAPRSLSPVASLAGYRIVQEGLTNAAKHGDGNVELTTTWDDGGLTIVIANAVGAAAAAADSTGAGLGLVGMRERAAVNGGRLTADVRDDRFVVEAWLPTEREAGR